MARQAAVSRTQEDRTQEAKALLRQAALELFATDGYDAITLAAISLKAGFSRTLAQYHYADKGALAVELLDERMRRDNHVDLLDCPDDAPAAVAWQALLDHLAAVTDYYGALHGGGERSMRLRGEMAIHAAALMSPGGAINARVNVLTRDLIARVERLLAICRTQGLVARQTDAHATAVLYVHSIWGLALALFASPKATRQITAAMQQIGAMLMLLRNRN